MSKAYVMGGKKRDGAGNRVGSGKAPRLKPGAKKPGAIKKAVRKDRKEAAGGRKAAPSQPSAPKQRKGGATVYKRADGSKTVVKKKANGTTRVTERDSSGKKTSTTRSKATASGHKTTTRGAGGKKTVTKTKGQFGSKGMVKKTTKKDGPLLRCTKANGNRVIKRLTPKETPRLKSVKKAKDGNYHG